MPSAPEVAASILAECEALPVRNTPSLRLVRRKYTRLLKEAQGDLVLQIARELRQTDRYRWFGYELVRAHPAAFKRWTRRSWKTWARVWIAGGRWTPSPARSPVRPGWPGRSRTS